MAGLEKALFEFIHGELSEQFPEISCKTNGEKKVAILLHGKDALTEEKKSQILKAITDRFFLVREFRVGLDDKFNLGTALKK